MDSIKFDYSKICNFVTKEEMVALYPEARQALKSLKEGTGKGSDFLGWLTLPVEITSEPIRLFNIFLHLFFRHAVTFH